jgi:predicted glycosyltransferase
MGDANVLRKKVLIVWEHGGNLGHLSRLLPVALALRQAGYDVVFSVADVSSARRYLGALHFDFVMLPRIVLLVAHESGALNHADVFLKAGFGEAGRAKLCIRQWHDLFKSVKPAAVLVDSSPFAL